jgi:hypothetical protein
MIMNQQKLLNEVNRMIDYVKEEIRATLTGSVSVVECYEMDHHVGVLTRYVEFRTNLLGGIIDDNELHEFLLELINENSRQSLVSF